MQEAGWCWEEMLSTVSCRDPASTIGNQEDSIILNKASLERGLFRTTYFRTYSDSEAKVGQHYEQFCIPEEANKNSAATLNVGRRYELLDEDGTVGLGLRVTTNDVIIGKTTPITAAVDAAEVQVNSSKLKTLNKDSSKSLRAHEHGIVDSVLRIHNENERERKMVKIRLRKTRIPEIGDKLSSRAAQKGTIGMILPQEDMPFTSEGITPDLIMNPHAIPSQHSA